MESIIDCYFDNIFTQMDRGCLIPRYKRRQIVDYFSTVIRACSTDSSCHEEGCKKAVEAIIKFHKKAKDNNGSVCLLGKYHNVLYVALKLCFDWKLNDHVTVTTVLLDLFSCEKTFERLMIGAIFGTRVTHLISGWKSDFQSRDECLQAVEYFLEHAAKTNLKFKIGGKFKTMADIPMPSYGFSTPAKVCIQTGKYDFLRVLIRFGAEPVIVTNHNQCPLHLLLLRMHTLAESAPESLMNPLFPPINGQISESVPKEPRNPRSYHTPVPVLEGPRNSRDNGESNPKEKINSGGDESVPEEPQNGEFEHEEPRNPKCESVFEEPKPANSSSQFVLEKSRNPSNYGKSFPDKSRTPKSHHESFSKEQRNPNNNEPILRSPIFPDDLIRCLQVFLTVIPQVPHTIFDNENEPVVLHPAVLAMVPEEKSGWATATLKHLCRCVIRKCLVVNGCLPYGIYELKLPMELQKYIDMGD